VYRYLFDLINFILHITFMKKFYLPFLFLFSSFFSFPSFGEWTKLGNIVSANMEHKGIDYIDFKSIRKSGDYIYYWILNDFKEPKKIGHLKSLSMSYYFQGDCKMYRFKNLSISVFTKNMANGLSKDVPGSAEWIFPNPNTNFIRWLNIACKHLGF